MGMEIKRLDHLGIIAGVIKELELVWKSKPELTSYNVTIEFRR
jgi:hypothetical protein